MALFHVVMQCSAAMILSLTPVVGKRSVQFKFTPQCSSGWTEKLFKSKKHPFDFSIYKIKCKII